MEQGIIILAFFFLYFNISGLSTTNILRLTTGNNLPILASECVCGSCGNPIKPFYQLPIISYILCKGKCRNCNSKIPTDGLLLEIAILIGMFFLSATMSFSLLGNTISFVFYETIRVIVIAIKGKRCVEFGKQYFIAVVAMVPYYLVTLFVALIYKVVCG